MHKSFDFFNLSRNPRIKNFASIFGNENGIFHPDAEVFARKSGEDIASKHAIHAAEKLVGKEKTIAIPYPSLGGEDFSYYLQQVQGCFVRFGGAKEGHEMASSHSSKFDFDEDVLRIGAAYLSELVRYTIKKLRK